jgi:hypothetical protein
MIKRCGVNGYGKCFHINNIYICCFRIKAIYNFQTETLPEADIERISIIWYFIQKGSDNI